VGRYPAAGLVPVSHTRDTAGPMARGIGDLIVLDRIMAGDSAPRQPVALDGLRLGVPRDYFFADLDAGVAGVIEASLSALSRAGVRLVEADVPDLAPMVEAIGFPVVLFEVMRDLPDYLRRSGCGIDLDALIEGVGSPDVRAIFDSQRGAEAMPEAAYRAAMDEHRPALRRAYADYFREHDLEAAVFATTRLPARPIGDDETVELNGARIPTFAAFIANTDPGSNAGLPGVSLPAGLAPDGLPVGLAIDGPEGGDRRLLAIAEAIEGELPEMPAPKMTAGAFQSAAHHATK
jgi:mandelamide amidase